MKNASGKFVIIGILIAAAAAAGTAWWFRYSATREATEFWGPDAAAMIRDAPHVALIALEPGKDSPQDLSTSDAVVEIGNQLFAVKKRWDISSAPGLSHLRNALLEDRTFVSIRSFRPQDWNSGLEFRTSPDSGALRILFASNYATLLRHWPGHGDDRINHCDAIESGLQTTFCEWSEGELCHD
jgi:hypothetical protein